MHTLRRLASIVITLGILFSGVPTVFAQEITEKYFPETGHTVSGEFLDYYNSVTDPLLLFGYPITDAFQDPLSGITVQYFQRARFEKHIEAEEGKRVQLSNLGELLYIPGQEMVYSTDAAACQYFEQRNRYVCYSFLEFFKANGGEAQFGQPISNIEKQDDLYVQYFDRARLEWHPELPTGQRVTLADLGSIYFDLRGGDPSLLEPAPRDSITQEIIHLDALAFVENAVLAPNSEQTLYVVVRDQYLKPVALTEVAVTISYPSGEQSRTKLPLTNEYGYTQYTFKVGAEAINQVVDIDVEVVKGNLQDMTGTWFRIWW